MARILIVEDDMIAADLSALRLRRVGHFVDIVNNGLEGLTALEAAPNDIVITDVMMPEMDGITMVRAIRGSGRAYAAIPVVGLSATTNPVNFPKMLAAGMNVVLTKPAPRDTLCTTIAELLRETRSQADVIELFRRDRGNVRVTG
jgi:CheY-like chemotaxis protein